MKGTIVNSHLPRMISINPMCVYSECKKLVEEVSVPCSIRRSSISWQYTQLQHLEEHYRCVGGDELVVEASKALRSNIHKVFQPIREVLEHKYPYNWLGEIVFRINDVKRVILTEWIKTSNHRCRRYGYRSKPSGTAFPCFMEPFTIRNMAFISGKSDNGTSAVRWESTFSSSEQKALIYWEKKGCDKICEKFLPNHPKFHGWIRILKTVFIGSANKELGIVCSICTTTSSQNPRMWWRASVKNCRTLGKGVRSHCW